MAATTLGRLNNRLVPLAQLLWANPVVIRDLRVLLRGAKSFWGIGLYLFCLAAIVLVGYGTSTFQSGKHGYVSAVDIQEGLQTFYYVVFMTIAALLSLIAPALTAASVTAERQRLTMDLLVTTPLSSAQLLTGKIISSVAFLVLLLVLSLPASALCIILGGATLGDVFRIYAILAVGSLLLAAIGIAFSCSMRASLAAVIWTYLAVAGFELFTGILFGTSMAARASALALGGGRGAMSGLDPTAALFALNPFVGVYVGTGSIALFGFHIPVWIASAVVMLILVRLLLTTAACRLRLYGGNTYASLRRQLLFITALVAVSVASAIGSEIGAGSFGHADQLVDTIIMLTIAFLVPGALLYPSLFVPAYGEDLPARSQTGGWYRPWRAFKAEHAGALPFFHLWLLTLVLGAGIGFWFGGVLSWDFAGDLLLAGLYISGLGILYWSLARLAGIVVSQLSGARALAFALFALVAAIPMMAMGLTGGDMTDNPIAAIWIFYPLVEASNSGATGWTIFTGIYATLWTTALCYAMAAFVCFIIAMVERRRKVQENALPAAES